MITYSAERFNDSRYSRPRYRLRASERLSWIINGYTFGSFKYKRDAVAHCVELNKAPKEQTT